MLMAIRASRTKLELVAAAFLAAAVYLGTLVVRRVHPFGDRSILAHDLTGQYSALLSYLREAALGPAGLMFTWQGDLGMNFYPLAAYYLASPFNVIVVLTPDQHLPEAIVAITAGKLALAGGTMAWYLRRTFPGPRPLVVAAAVAYATMSWVLFNAFNIMWLDALYLLPLVLLAVERVLAGRGILPLALATAATMITNYYVGMMVMLFAGLYLVVRYVAARRDAGVADFLVTGVRSAIAAGIGLLCAGALIIPSYVAIRGRNSKPGPVWTDDVPLPWADLLASMIGGSMRDKLDAPPHLAIGTATLVLALVFFAVRTNPLRERIGFAALTTLLVASCQVPFLYLLWHGFESPNSYSHRFGFLLGFLFVLLGYRAALAAKGKVAAGGLVLAGGLALVTASWAAGVRPSLVSHRVLTWTVVVVGAVVVVGLVYLLLRGRERVRRPLVGVLAAVLLIDASGAAALESTKLVKVPRERWDMPGPAWGAALRAARPARDEFFRADALMFASPNDALRFGNFALTHFTSITNGRAHRTFRRLGFSDQLETVRFDYQGSTLVTDALFGFRYVLSDRPLHRHGFRLFQQAPADPSAQFERPLYVYENANALPVGFFFDDVEPLDPDSKSPFAHLANLVGNEKLFSNACPGRPAVRGGSISMTPASVFLTRADKAKTATLRWQCKATGARQLYAWYEGARSVSEVSIDREPSIPFPTFYAAGPLDLGQRTDTTFTFEITTRAKHLAVPRPVVHGLDLASFQRWVDGERQRGAKAVRWSSAGLSVEVDDDRGGRFFLSVPHIPGWQARVDGRPAPIQTTAGAFIGLDLAPGAHRIELAFRPPGLRAGLVVSAAGLAGILLLVVAALRRRSRSSAPRTPRPSEPVLSASRSGG